MQGFYVLLTILGIICVILSFMLTEKLEERNKDISVSEDMLKKFVEKNEENLDKAIKAHVAITKETALEETTRELNRLTNEKIMAVDEFSEGVLEKISQNHSEVLFLYDMLSEKEKELKEFVSEVNQAANKSVAKMSGKAGKRNGAKSLEENPKRHNNQKSRNDKRQKGELGKSVPEFSTEQKKEESNSREKILQLHEDGCSITDIAKQLNMGKGEIKLIIDLYQGARK